MKNLHSKNLARTFSEFIFENENYENSLLLLEASFLNQLGLPQSMIKKIHRKKEHISDKYPRTGHMYKRGTPLAMPYKYYQPAADLELPEPTRLTGAYSYSSPFEDRENEKSQYKDIAWYLISLQSGQPLRVLLTDENKSAFFYIYNKSLSAQNIPGDQFAIVISFKDDTDEWKTIDVGFGETVTFGASLNLIGKRHESKGGNRTDKVMEMIKALTGGPSKNNAILAYNLEIMQAGKPEPRELRTIRSRSVGLAKENSAIPVIEKFAQKYTSFFERSQQAANRLKMAVDELLSTSRSSRPSNVPVAVEEMANVTGINKSDLFLFLFVKMRDFRKALLDEGKGNYTQTPGEDLEADNQFLNKGKFGFQDSQYQFKIEMVDPDEVAGARRGSQYVESKPENAVAVPQPGDYASIKSMIQSDSEMGVLGNFMNYILTGSIRNIDPEASLAKMLGMTTAQYRSFTSGEEDIVY